MRGRTTTVLVCVLGGLLMTVSAIAARGTDLRSDREADMRDLIVSQGRRNEELQHQSARLTEQVSELTGAANADDGQDRALAEAQAVAGLSELHGPGVRVTLNDAPVDVKPAGVDDDALVVHQQDIQAVVNALWDGGAEAMTIQGQRVISTTGIKCVGNTVVLHGVPHAPPYVIEAIGDQAAMQASLDSNPSIQIYRQYVAAYRLGYKVDHEGDLTAPEFSGSVTLTSATKG